MFFHSSQFNLQGYEKSSLKWPMIHYGWWCWWWWWRRWRLWFEQRWQWLSLCRWGWWWYLGGGEEACDSRVVKLIFIHSFFHSFIHTTIKIFYIQYIQYIPHTHSYTHTHTHTHIHTHTHTRTHTYTGRQTQSYWSRCFNVFHHHTTKLDKLYWLTITVCHEVDRWPTFIHPSTAARLTNRWPFTRSRLWTATIYSSPLSNTSYDQIIITSLVGSIYVESV